MFNTQNKYTLIMKREKRKLLRYKTFWVNAEKLYLFYTILRTDQDIDHGISYLI